MRALLHRHAEPLIIVQFGHARLELVAQRQRREKGVGHRILAIDPALDLGVVAHVILEPAIGIGDRGPELGLADIAAARRRIGQGGGRGGAAAAFGERAVGMGSCAAVGQLGAGTVAQALDINRASKGRVERMVSDLREAKEKARAD